MKKMVLEILQNSQENTFAWVSFLIKLQAKESLAQVFSCEFCEIFKNTFFYRTPLVAASIYWCVICIFIWSFWYIFNFRLGTYSYDRNYFGVI